MMNDKFFSYTNLNKLLNNISYKIGDETHSIIIKNKIDKFLSNKIDSISSDKKVLLNMIRKLKKISSSNYQNFKTIRLLFNCSRISR